MSKLEWDEGKNRIDFGKHEMALRRRPVEYDEDCPPLSPAMREAAERMIAAGTRHAQ